ncbi:unnamed protein product [Cladocopium goreaui]|uniref:Uncharacterized protein n=1 Tax=Cladocopium goreaui TaxID=2562237 RepID=A0A9P1D4S9_9DINO|nr:unnamed protein product [Cladocopium goreaui]
MVDSIIAHFLLKRRPELDDRNPLEQYAAWVGTAARKGLAEIPHQESNTYYPDRVAQIFVLDRVGHDKTGVGYKDPSLATNRSLALPSPSSTLPVDLQSTNTISLLVANVGFINRSRRYPTWDGLMERPYKDSARQGGRIHSLVCLSAEAIRDAVDCVIEQFEGASYEVLHGARSAEICCVLLNFAKRIPPAGGTSAAAMPKPGRVANTGNESVPEQSTSSTNIDVHKKRPVSPLRFEEKTLIFESQVDVKEVILTSRRKCQIGAALSICGFNTFLASLSLHGALSMQLCMAACLGLIAMLGPWPFGRGRFGGVLGIERWKH